MKSEIVCDIDPCLNNATSRVRFNHPMPYMRFECNICVTCLKNLFSECSYMPGTGEPSIIGFPENKEIIMTNQLDIARDQIAEICGFERVCDNDRPAFDAACEKIRKECGK